MSNEQEIDIKSLLTDINHKLDNSNCEAKKPTNIIRIWIPIFLIMFQLFAGIWFISRYFGKVEQNDKDSLKDRKDLRTNQSVIIGFMEDSLNYNHSNRVMEYEMKQNYLDYLKQESGTRSGVKKNTRIVKAIK